MKLDNQDKKGTVMKKILLSAFLISTCSTVNAGFNGTTFHSRANCINNESISWDATSAKWFMTISEHYNRFNGALIHAVKTPMEITKRSAAVHYGEAPSSAYAPFGVKGYHFMKDNRGGTVLITQEYVTDCSLYDGWWEMK